MQARGPSLHNMKFSREMWETWAKDSINESKQLGSALQDVTIHQSKKQLNPGMVTLFLTNVNGNPKVVVAYPLPRPLGSKIKYKTVPNVRCYIFLIKYMI